jgi:hypothetical protein
MWISQAIMLLLSAAVLWLGIVEFSTLGVALVVFGMGGILIILLVAALTGRLRIGGIGAREWTVAALGLILIVVVNIGLLWLFGAPMDVGPSSAGTWAERVIVNVLFAIYEENLMLGLFSAGKAGNIPDVYLVIGAAFLFVPLHAWVRGLDLLFAMFLIVGRSVLTGLYAISDHSDPSYITHILWNVVNS